jgi:hypothetical protein
MIYWCRDTVPRRGYRRLGRVGNRRQASGGTEKRRVRTGEDTKHEGVHMMLQNRRHNLDG